VAEISGSVSDFLIPFRLALRNFSEHLAGALAAYY
jgi:hypothetical protein